MISLYIWLLFLHASELFYPSYYVYICIYKRFYNYVVKYPTHRKLLHNNHCVVNPEWGDLQAKAI